MDLRTRRGNFQRRNTSPPGGRVARTWVDGWELVELAYEGPWSQVYRGRPSSVARAAPATYAIKLARGEGTRCEIAVEMLQREAIVGRVVSHRNLMPVLESRVLDEPRYVVLPWLGGETIAARLKNAPFSVPHALWIARQVAEALEALDRAGWVHGDVKPANILMSVDAHATLSDFGLARRRGEERWNSDDVVAGSGLYLAPEAATSALRVDIRSDLYSLGVMLYEMLSGVPPFRGTCLAELIGEHRRARPPELREVAAHVSPGVASFVHSLLAKQPLRRPQTPREVVERLVELEIATFSERQPA